jgi:hypothetical protein
MKCDFVKKTQGRDGGQDGTDNQLLFVSDSDREAALLEAKVQPEFGLNARQLDMVRECIEKKGIEYVREKIAVVDSEPRKNAARTFLAALKGDWKLPVKRVR